MKDSRSCIEKSSVAINLGLTRSLRGTCSTETIVHFDSYPAMVFSTLGSEACNMAKMDLRKRPVYLNTIARDWMLLLSLEAFRHAREPQW